MYTGVSTSRNNEVMLRWHRNSMFIVIHSGGFSFVLSQLPAVLFPAVLSFLGMFLGGVWILVNWKTQEWVNFWHRRIEAIESNKQNPLKVKIYSSRRFRRLNAEFPTFYQILMMLSIMATGGWLAVFV